MTTDKKAVPDHYYDYVYRFMYFILTPVAKYIPTKIKPNQITILSFVCAMLGTILLWAIASPIGYLYWILFNFLWLVFDSLDGMHARFTGQTSEFGGFLDHALDCIYFIFMWTVIAIKFDLFYPLYFYILMLRTTAATMVFLTQFHCGKMYLSRFTGGLEFVLLTLVMLLTYCHPTMNVAFLTQNTFLLHCILYFHLQTGFFMKVVLFIYFVGTPINYVQQFCFVRRNLEHDMERMNGSASASDRAV